MSSTKVICFVLRCNPFEQSGGLMEGEHGKESGIHGYGHELFAVREKPDHIARTAGLHIVGAT